MIKYNLDFLVKVEVIKQKPCRYYKYKSEKKFLGFVTRKEGFYCEFNRREETPDFTDVPNWALFIDGVLYDKPRVELTFTNEECSSRMFNTIEEAKEYASLFTVSDKWIAP